MSFRVVWRFFYFFLVLFLYFSYHYYPEWYLYDWNNKEASGTQIYVTKGFLYPLWTDVTIVPPGVWFSFLQEDFVKRTPLMPVNGLVRVVSSVLAGLCLLLFLYIVLRTRFWDDKRVNWWGKRLGVKDKGSGVDKMG